MIRIAVVDDEEIMLEIIYYRIKNVLSSENQEHDIKCYTNGSDLLKDHETHPFDLAFLDIDMPEITGLQIAQKLRNRDSKTEIIFITNKSDLVFESIKYTPFRFVRKTRMDYEMEEAIISFLNKLKKTQSVFEFSTSEGKRTVLLTSVIYLESHSHKITVVMTTDSFTANGNLKDIEKNIVSLGFIRIHQSFLVNYRYIFFVKQKELLLDNGNSLPVSRGKYETVKKELMKYMKENGQ